MLTARDRQDQERLETLLDHAERVGRRLSFDDLRELAHLYRLSSARLAILRSQASDPEAIRYLNALCVRAYTHLQASSPRKRRPLNFFIADLPATLAATAWLQGLTALVLLAGGLIGAAIVSENPGALYALIPARMYPPEEVQLLINSSQERAHFLAHQPLAFGIKSIFSAGLFVHNLQVGLLAFATGILAGLPTLLLVFYNGLTLGGFVWLFSRDAGWPVFWAWILPHAIPELLAVTLCATGGLVIARSVVAPGRRGVAASLRAAVGPALQLVLAALPLFVVAAGIESFLRQSTLSTGTRFAAAAVALGAILGYAWYVRRLVRRGAAPDLGWLVTEATPDGSQDSGSEPAR